jgi:hypothetical protein
MPQNTGLGNAAAGNFAGDLRQFADVLPRRISIDPNSVEQGLAKLVLTLIEFISVSWKRSQFAGWRVPIWLPNGSKISASH